MAASIPEDKIFDIQNACNIVDVISEVVQLKKTGSNFVGLCPFHSEKTGSFTVSPTKQMFYCFGCGEGGNVYTFVMKQEGISFPEAAASLARRYGIEISREPLSPDQKQQISDRESILLINRQAMDYFYSVLNDRIAGEKAMTYLIKRGITQEMIKRFNLGFAPDGWDNALNYFSKQKTLPALVEKAGLIVSKSGKDGYYDRFRNRIMFPIMDVRMQVIGFGGRVMDDSQPKYLNSPETPVYNKSRSLYGLNLSRFKCRETNAVYIVEGYVDLLTMVQHGIENVVATLGTALTSDHVRMLKGYTDRMILVYDSDEAGIKAAQRSIEIFRKENVDPHFLILTQGYDPDSFLRKFGTQAFKDAADRSMGMISFMTESAIKKHGLSIEGKLRIISDLKVPLASIRDGMARALYIRDIAERIGINESSILEKVREVSGNENSVSVRREPINNNKQYFERQIIAMMLQFPEVAPEINSRSLLDYFEDSTLKAIGDIILKSGNISFRDIIHVIHDEQQKRIAASLAIQKEEAFSNPDGRHNLLDQFEKCCRPKNRVAKKIETAEKDDFDLVRKLLEQENQRLKLISEKQKMRFKKV